MGNKLFVGSLSFDTDDARLQQEFERFGTVTEAKVILDRDSGRSRGFGFVTFANADDAARAVEEMNGAILDGRNLTVNEARERNDRPRGGGGGGGGRDDRRRRNGGW